MTGDVLIRAPFLHTPGSPFHSPAALVCHDDGALLVRNGRIAASGDHQDVAPLAAGIPTLDWRGGYVLPGFVDTHVHFPQFHITGALGRSLLDWLAEVALPEEARMADAACAEVTARRFVQALLAHGTTTAMVFGAHFACATATLFETAAARGLRMLSGLVLSDRALLPGLHQTPGDGYRESTALIERFHGQGRLLYAVTPRFALSTSEAMLEVCQTLVREHPGVRVQTHINEQPDEVAACLAAFPWAADYLAIYERYALTGPRTVLAHNVHATDAELARLSASGTSVAHCPCSNASLGSGIFPMRRHLDAGVRMALGTDVGAGTGVGMLKETLQAGLMQRVGPDRLPLDAGQLLYLATRAGADALGLGDETGDLTAGRSADLVYVRPVPESPLAAALERADDLRQALAAIITMGDAGAIAEVWVSGERVFTAGSADASGGPLA